MTGYIDNFNTKKKYKKTYIDKVKFHKALVDWKKNLFKFNSLAVIHVQISSRVFHSILLAKRLLSPVSGDFHQKGSRE